MQAIDRSDVCLLVINAEEGIIEHDKHIASYALDAGKAIVIVVNKWDTIEDKDGDYHVSPDWNAFEVAQQTSAYTDLGLSYTKIKLPRLVIDEEKTITVPANRELAGAATGKVVFSAEEAVEKHKAGEKDLVLVRLETSPEDIEGMNVCNGVLTVRGGMTSHAAVVARGMGTCCVSGCGEITVNEEEKYFKDAKGNVYKEGDYISLDGSTGKVYGTKIETEEPSLSGNLAKLMEWADEYRKLGIR